MRPPPQIPSVQQKDDEQNRWQAQVESILNPFLRRAAMVPEEFTSFRVPTADATWLGRMIIVHDAGYASTLQVCLKNSSGGFEWVAIATST